MGHFELGYQWPGPRIVDETREDETCIACLEFFACISVIPMMVNSYVYLCIGTCIGIVAKTLK